MLCLHRLSVEGPIPGLPASACFGLHGGCVFVHASAAWHLLSPSPGTCLQAKRRLDFFGHLLQPQAATSHARLPHQSAYADGPLAAARMVQLNALQRLLMQNHVAVQVAVRKLQQVQEQQQCVSMSGDEANSAIESATAGTGPSLAGLVGLDYSAVRTFPAITLGKPKGCCA